MKRNFQLILNCQTPLVSSIVDSIEDKQLIVDFIEFAISLPNCIGLAANQVSLDSERLMKRFFVVKYSQVVNDKTVAQWLPVLNPQIVKYHGVPLLKTEGCKTWPGKGIIVERYPKIDVLFQIFTKNDKISTVQKTLLALEAQVFQHEIDHLNGIEEKFTNHIQRKNIQRNDLCPCGSGKKYKYCCMNNSLR